jgi:hypothetical protein
MTDLHAREVEGDPEEGPLVELVEEDRVVGVVYFDEDATYVEFNADEDGSAWAFDVEDLQRVLDTARAIVDPDGTFVLEGPAPTERNGHPVDVLAERFDTAAAMRGEEDEGFYPPAAVAQIITACNELDLAVIVLEGMTREEDEVVPIPGLTAELGQTQAGEAWPVFRAGCNVGAEAMLERWGPRDDRFVIAVEVADRDGETYVL